MNKLFNLIMAILIGSYLVMSPAYAGDVMQAGTVLEETSYVFTLEEAQNLKRQLETLEAEVANKNKIIFEYKELDKNLTSQVSGLHEVISIKDLQLTEYQSMHQLDLSRVSKLERQNNTAKVEKWAFFGVGIGVTIGSILIADKIDDSVQGPQLGSPVSSSKSAPLLRF